MDSGERLQSVRYDNKMMFAEESDHQIAREKEKKDKSE